MPDPDILIQQYLEGTLTDREAEELHQLLRDRPELGGQLLGQFNIDAMLAATKPLGGALESKTVLAPRRRFTFAALTGVAAMAACITLLGTWALLSFTDGSSKDEDTTASVAVLTRGVNLEWMDNAHAPELGTPLVPGMLHLKSGIAQIEFYQGARVLIEGPADLQLVSSGEAACTKGRLNAHVPPQARGFRILTPKGSVVDMGTEFGLNVTDAIAEVHVFKGSVQVQPNGTAMQSLTEGQAMALASAAPITAADAQAFASLHDLDARTAASLRTQFERWQLTSASINHDPALRLHLDFQDTDEMRTLLNHADNAGGFGDGSIVGCAWTEGRWPGKRALEFRNVSDRVRLGVPGEVKAMTMSAWVRVGGLDRMFNSLFMSEGWGERKVHWQITREGKVRLGVAGAEHQGHIDYDTPPIFTPERFGRWLHLAVVFDPASKEVRHYVDGELAARLNMKNDLPLRIGVAELGNWNDRGRPGYVAIRHLSGAMDEFAFYAKALTDAEIAVLAK